MDEEGKASPASVRMMRGMAETLDVEASRREKYEAEVTDGTEKTSGEISHIPASA